MNRAKEPPAPGAYFPVEPTPVRDARERVLARDPDTLDRIRLG